MDIHKNFPRVSECCRCVWQLLYQGWLWHLTPPHTQRLAEYGCDIKRRFFLRFVQHGQMVFSLERIAFRMMVVRFRIVLNTSTPTITFHTTMSIPKVRIPLHEQFLTPPTTQTAADSGSVVQLTRLVSLSAPHALACSSLVGSTIRNATTSARVNKDSNGQPPSTKSKPQMPSVRILKTSSSGSTSGR